MYWTNSRKLIFIMLLIFNPEEGIGKSQRHKLRKFRIKYQNNRLVKIKDDRIQQKFGPYKRKPVIPINLSLFKQKMSGSDQNEEISKILRKMDERLAFCGRVDLREATISDLQKAMATKHVTSLDLVRCYSERIKSMDPYLNAIIQMNPDAEMIAKKLDLNRQNGILHGPLHGIPILIKDNIATNDKMETTAGSLSLVGIRPKEDAEVVRRLRRAGAVILGKTNLSEFANFRGTKVPNAWSSRGNQTKSPFVLSKDPDGSSSGSAVAVSANLIPIALGTETDGSIIDPSSKCSLVGLKPSIKRIPSDGVIPLSFSQDVVGPITRNVADAAILFHVISKYGFKDNCFSVTSGLDNCGVTNLHVGVLRDPNWEQPEVAEQIQKLEEVLKLLKYAGVAIKDPVEASPGTLSTVTRESEILVFNHEFKHGLNSYLRNDVKSNLNKDGFYIRSLNDIIEFNKRYPMGKKYNQDHLIESESTDGIFNKTYVAEREKNIAGAKLYSAYIFEKYELDAIIIPTLNSSQIPSVAGYPIMTVPIGVTKDRIPFGISIYGMMNSDEVLLQLAHLIEKHVGGRTTPSFFP